MVDVKIDFVTYVVGVDPYKIEKDELIHSMVLKVTKKDAKLLAEYQPPVINVI